MISVWFALVTAATATDGPSPEVVLARMREAQLRLSTLSADLEQVKSYPQLGIEDPAERGRIFLARSKNGKTSVRMEISEPEVRILTVVGGEYLLYQPRIKQVLEGKASAGGKKAIFSGILTGSPEALEELERDYRVERAEDGGSVHSGVVTLRFTARPDTVVYCQILELSVDTTSWLPMRQSCHEPNRSVITFSLDNVTLNVPLDPDVFEVAVPLDVERVRG